MSTPSWPSMKAPAARGRSGRSSGRASGSDWSPRPLFLLTTPLAHAYFHHAGHDPEVVVEEIAYYDVLIFGSGAIILAGTLSSFFTGRGATRVVMAVDSTAAALNAVLAYLWIFGQGGFPCGGHCRGRRGHGLRGVVPRALLLGHHAAAPLSPLSPGSGLALEPGLDAAALDLRRRRAACSGSIECGFLHALHHPGRRAGKDQSGRHHAGLQCQQRGLGADDGHRPGRLDDGRPATGGQSARHGRAGHLDGFCAGHDLHVQRCRCST